MVMHKTRLGECRRRRRLEPIEENQAISSLARSQKGQACRVPGGTTTTRCQTPCPSSCSSATTCSGSYPSSSSSSSTCQSQLRLRSQFQCQLQCQPPCQRLFQLPVPASIPAPVQEPALAQEPELVLALGQEPTLPVLRVTAATLVIMDVWMLDTGWTWRDMVHRKKMRHVSPSETLHVVRRKRLLRTARNYVMRLPPSVIASASMLVRIYGYSDISLVVGLGAK
jgi:hypothetical protein